MIAVQFDESITLSILWGVKKQRGGIHVAGIIVGVVIVAVALLQLHSRRGHKEMRWASLQMGWLGCSGPCGCSAPVVALVVLLLFLVLLVGLVGPVHSHCQNVHGSGIAVVGLWQMRGVILIIVVSVVRVAMVSLQRDIAKAGGHSCQSHCLWHCCCRVVLFWHSLVFASCR